MSGATLSRYFCVLCTVMLVTVVVFFVMSFLTSATPPEYADTAPVATERSLKALYTAAERRMIHMDVEEWVEKRDRRDRCEELTERRQMEDVECRAELMYRMRSLLPSRIHSVMQFLDARTGVDWYAMEISLGESMRAWFKPCSCGDVEVAGRRQKKAPIEPSRGYPPMLTVSSRLDPRFLRSQSFGMSSWAQWVVAASRECGEELQFTKHHSFPRLPGCLLLWNNATAHYIRDELSTDLEHVLQSLTCERIQLDGL